MTGQWKYLPPNDQRISKWIRAGRERIGYLTAFYDETEKVVTVGYSVCNTKHDEFDSQKGVEIAIGRALNCDYAHMTVEDLESKLPKFAPHSLIVRGELVNFLQRIKRYYKDKNLYPVFEEIAQSGI